ncbi:MAG: hypothetical protein H8Z69_01385 [Nanohaloarchaea archaeon]|nr:hypothetical protein [Candidatus Nanohaloarchaea archaeon]
MGLDENKVRQLIPDETLENIPEGYEQEVYDAVASGRKASGAIGAVLHYEEDLNQKEAADKAGVTPVTVRETGEALGYGEDNSDVVEGYKALVPEKFHTLIDNHIEEDGGKAKTYTAGIYSVLTENTPDEAAEVFNASNSRVARNASRVEKYLEAEEIAGEEFRDEIYSSNKPKEAAKAIEKHSGVFADKIASSSEPKKTSQAIEFFVNDEGLKEEGVSFVPNRQIQDLMYGEDGLGAEKTAEILSERVPDDYEEDLMNLTISGKDPRIVSSVILENETDMNKKEIQKTAGTGTFETKRHRDEINELFEG